MQINISGTNVEITPALEEHINQKIQRIADHFSEITQAHVVMHIDDYRQAAEATLNIKGGKLYAEASSPDMYETINELYHKLDRQVKKHKEKMKDHNGGRD